MFGSQKTGFGSTGFGSSTNTFGGNSGGSLFGSSNTTSTPSNSLFGNNNQQQQQQQQQNTGKYKTMILSTVLAPYLVKIPTQKVREFIRARKHPYTFALKRASL